MTDPNRASWRNPDTGEVWVLARRFVPPNWKRVEEQCTRCGRKPGSWHCRCAEKRR